MRFGPKPNEPPVMEESRFALAHLVNGLAHLVSARGPLCGSFGTSAESITNGQCQPLGHRSYISVASDISAPVPNEPGKIESLW
jgi:hypothetical protein